MSQSKNIASALFAAPSRMSDRSSGHAGSTDHNRPRTARLLLFSGWAVALLYLPSGLMHAMFGHAVYFRDILLFIHLFGCFYYLRQTRELLPLVRNHWVLFVPVLFILPAFLNGGARVEALTFVKWALLWTDWIILGRLAAQQTTFPSTAKILLGLTVLVLVADLGAGVYERATHTYVISADYLETTAFGVGLDVEQRLGEQLRVKGLQRDVFSFANLMGACTVFGLLTLVNVKPTWQRWTASLWTLAFATMLLMSGGRSAFFGVFAACITVLGLWRLPDKTRSYFPYLVLGWLLVCLMISLVGVGRLTEFVGGSVFGSSGVGNAQSAYMRDQEWLDILETIGRVPIVLMFGGPLSAIFDQKVAPFYHWVDNEYYWLLYHTGVPGFIAAVWYFRTTLTSRRLSGYSSPWTLDAVVLFLLFVMGEAIARESLAFTGVLPLFVAIGYHEVARSAFVPTVQYVNKRTDSRQRRATHPAANELTRRVQARLRNKKQD